LHIVLHLQTVNWGTITLTT